MRRLVSMLALLTLALLVPAGSAWGAWPDDGSYTAWSKCFRLTTQASKINAALSWYFLDLADMPPAFWGAVKSDGSDIRTTRNDGETVANHKLIYINTGTSTGLLAIAQPHGSGGASSDVDTYLYVGNAAASTASTNSTWPSTLSALHMLQEEPTSSTSVIDWTGKGNGSALIQGSMTSGDLVTGAGPHSGLKVIDFDSNDRVRFPSTLLDPAESANAFTIFAWVRPSNDVDNYGIFGTGGNQVSLTFVTSSYNTLDLTTRNSTNSGNFNVTGASDNMTPGVWQMVHATYDGSNIRIYVDGVLKGTSAASSLRSASLVCWLGNDNVTYFRGRITEFGVYSEALSTDQISTMYASETDSSFWSISEVTGGGGGSTDTTRGFFAFFG